MVQGQSAGRSGCKDSPSATSSMQGLSGAGLTCKRPALHTEDTMNQSQPVCTTRYMGWYGACTAQGVLCCSGACIACGVCARPVLSAGSGMHRQSVGPIQPSPGFCVQGQSDMSPISYSCKRVNRPLLLHLAGPDKQQLSWQLQDTQCLEVSFSASEQNKFCA